MTKAEIIFRDTFAACRKSAETWGRQYNPDGRPIGYNNLITEEPIYSRTKYAVQHLIDTERSTIRIREKLGILTGEALDLRKYALDMVQVTLDNTKPL